MRGITLILTLLLSWTLWATGARNDLAAPEGRFVNYGSAEGLSSNTVYAIAQDTDGFLWAGTRNGLNRFDGLIAVCVFRGIDFPIRRALVLGTYLPAEYLLVSGMVKRVIPTETE